MEWIFVIGVVLAIAVLKYTIFKKESVKQNKILNIILFSFACGYIIYLIYEVIKKPDRWKIILILIFVYGAISFYKKRISKIKSS